MSETGGTHKGLIRDLILVVDDEPALVDSICQFLSHLGHGLIGATSRAEALTAANTNAGRIALVIMDVMVEDDLGPFIVDDIMKINDGLRVLYLSGVARDEAVYRSEAKLPLAFLQKPCSLQIVSNTVERMLRSC